MDGDDTIEEFERVAMTGAAALSRAAEVLVRSAQGNKVRTTAGTARATEDLQRRAEAQSQAAEGYYARAAEPGWARTAGADEVALAWKGAQQWRRSTPVGSTATPPRSPTRSGPSTSSTRTRRAPGWRRRARGCREQVEARQTGRGAGRGTGWGASDEQVRGVSAGLEAGPRPAAVELDYDTAERRAATSAELTAAGVSAPAREAKMVADHLNGTDPQAVTTATPRRSRGPAGPQQTRGREHGRGR